MFSTEGIAEIREIAIAHREALVDQAKTLLLQQLHEEPTGTCYVPFIVEDFAARFGITEDSIDAAITRLTGEHTVRYDALSDILKLPARHAA